MRFIVYFFGKKVLLSKDGRARPIDALVYTSKSGNFFDDGQNNKDLSVIQKMRETDYDYHKYILQIS